MLCLHALTVLLYLLPFSTGQQGVCDLPYCVCNPAPHPSWTTINCTVPSDKQLDILEGDLPESTTELVIKGAEAVLFGTNSLSRLKDARRVRVEGAKIILMRKFAAVNLNVVSVYLEIYGCDVLRIEERTFTNIKGPLSVTIKNCETVSIGAAAFSWLLTMTIANVHQLQLSSGTFSLDRIPPNIEEHGTGMSIELKNLTVTEFTSQTFGSSAANITLDMVMVRAVRPEAFSANTYNLILAANSTLELVEGEAFAPQSLIYNLQFYGCKIYQLASRAIQSGISNLTISHTTIENIETNAINITVAAISISDCEFNTFNERGVELTLWNKFHMERNKFDDLAPNAIIATGSIVDELIFVENEIETIHENSLGFIGQTYAKFPNKVVFKNNYYGQSCHCGIKKLLFKTLNTEDIEPFVSESFCTVDEFFARCFNVPEQNMRMKKFMECVCGEESSIKCEPFTTENGTEIKNPRFPHKGKENEGLSDRNKKVIGIVLVTVFACIIIACFISLIRCMSRRGYCAKVKNFFISSNLNCASICDRLCPRGINNGLDNAGSISQMSVHEYSERHRLNEPRTQELLHETAMSDMYTEEIVPMEDKTTQTLPEELTKELLENLREKLEDPENYVEAREMIEHLYELIKVEESCNVNPVPTTANENIYELPFQNTVPRLGRNKKKMISVGTTTPSIDRLTPLSPYNRQTALVHEYFEPKDFAVHLYAEIANLDKDKKKLLNVVMPDVVAEQAGPRGPYLRAVRDKMNSSASSSPSTDSFYSFAIPSPGLHPSTNRSNKSSSSGSSGKMINRPLPKKPITFDPISPPMSPIRG